MKPNKPPDMEVTRKTFSGERRLSVPRVPSASIRMHLRTRITHFGPRWASPPTHDARFPQSAGAMHTCASRLSFPRNMAADRAAAEQEKANEKATQAKREALPADIAAKTTGKAEKIAKVPAALVQKALDHTVPIHDQTVQFPRRPQSDQSPEHILLCSEFSPLFLIHLGEGRQRKPKEAPSPSLSPSAPSPRTPTTRCHPAPDAQPFSWGEMALALFLASPEYPPLPFDQWAEEHRQRRTEIAHAPRSRESLTGYTTPDAGTRVEWFAHLGQKWMCADLPLVIAEERKQMEEQKRRGEKTTREELEFKRKMGRVAGSMSDIIS